MITSFKVPFTVGVRPPLDSVGLVCTCGQAVAGIEGVLAPCPGCGKVYLISVMVLAEATT